MKYHEIWHRLTNIAESISNSDWTDNKTEIEKIQRKIIILNKTIKKIKEKAENGDKFNKIDLLEKNWIKKINS